MSSKSGATRIAGLKDATIRVLGPEKDIDGFYLGKDADEELRAFEDGVAAPVVLEATAEATLAAVLADPGLKFEEAVKGRLWLTMSHLDRRRHDAARTVLDEIDAANADPAYDLREVIAAADEHGMAMVFTGMRHFRH